MDGYQGLKSSVLTSLKQILASDEDGNALAITGTTELAPWVLCLDQYFIPRRVAEAFCLKYQTTGWGIYTWSEELSLRMDPITSAESNGLGKKGHES